MTPSTLSDADLAAELLLCCPPPYPIGVPCANEREQTWCTKISNNALLQRKLSVARELLMRQMRSQMRRGPVMDSPQTLRDWLRLYCAGLQYEVLLVLYLSSSHALIDAVQLFRGTLTRTSVYPRELVKEALAHNCSALAIAHNHPSSGSIEPSHADKSITQDLRNALALVDVRLIDHFIVSGDRVLSFAECGLL